MRELRFSALAFLIFLGFLACNNPQSKGPQETAQAFLDAIAAGDYDGAKEFCTEGTKNNLSMFETFSGFGANPMAGSFEITREDIQGDYATVYYNKEGSEHHLRLHKDGMKWFVIANKGDIGLGGDKDKDEPKLDLTDTVEDEKPDPADLYKAERDGKSAKEIAEAFLLAYNYSDTDKAKHYCSKSSAEAVGMQSGLDTDGGSKSTDFSITKVEEKGDYASVFYTQDGSDQARELKLGKDKHGNWEVIMTKSDFSEWKEK